MDLSIIIVNWNSKAFLRNCLESILQAPPSLALEVIVVDNASYDGADRMLAGEFPRVRYVQSNENLGFARANNLGYKHSSGRHLLFLNPDTEIVDGAIDRMVAAADSLADAGAIGCRLLNSDGSLQTSCVQALPTILNQALDAEGLRARFPKSSLWGMEALHREGSEPRAVEMISGACLLVPRAAFESTGRFTEAYFMYGEDADLCRKIGATGRKLYYLPDAAVIHHGGQSTKQTGASTFSILLMQESLHTYFRLAGGRPRAALFRASRFVTACVRVALLAALRIAPGDAAVKSERQASLHKWKTILLWSAGLAPATKAPARSAHAATRQGTPAENKPPSTVETV